MCKIIDTRGLDISDIKSVLIQSEEVVDHKEFCDLLKDHANLLTICFLANQGNEKANKFIETRTTDLFNTFVPDNWKDEYIELNQKTLELFDTKEEQENENNYEELYNDLLFEYSKYVALTALAVEGDEFSLKYINEEAKSDFDGLVPDEVKDIVLSNLKNKLDSLYLKDDSDE